MKAFIAKPLAMRYLLVSLVLSLISLQSNAQTNAGKDFWVAQTPNLVITRTDTAVFGISVANMNSVPANVSIISANKPTINATLAPGALQTFTFPTENRNIQTTGTYLNNVYHVLSDQNVVVYSFDPLYNVITNDASLVLPKHALGKRYMAASFYNPVGGTANSFYGIIAIENATNIKVYDQAGTLKDDVNLNSGQYYQRVNPNIVDVTGWYIEASLPVAVLTGNQASSVGTASGASDHLVEQIIPIETLAKTYVAAPTNSRPIGCTVCTQDVFRYIATEDNTIITTSPNVGGGILNKGQFIQLSTNIPHVVKGNKPFYGFQYLGSQNSGTPAAGTGDPSLIAMPLLEQLQFRYTFVVPPSYPFNFVNIMTEAGANISLNGQLINPVWRTADTVNGKMYQSTTIPIQSGVHNISGDKKFGIVVSGFGTAASFAYMGGHGLQKINAGCISGGPYQALTCGNSSVSVQLNATPSCDNSSTPLIEWSSSNGVTFSDPNIANPVATVPGSGIFYVTLKVKCAGNEVVCETEIIVREPLVGCGNVSLPKLTPPASITIPADRAEVYASAVNLGAPVYIANQPVTLVNNGLLHYPNGITVVTWTLTDANGISTSGTQSVTVIPNPTITAPPAISLSNDAGKPYASTVLGDTATYISNWGPNTLTNNAPSQLPIGNTTVTWTITDGLGRTASATQVVTVESALPTITAPPTVTVTAGYNGFATGVTLGTATHTSSVDPTTLSNNGPSYYSIGTTSVTWTVTDGLGRTTSDVQQVVVVAPRPVIVPPANITVSNDPGQTYSTSVTFVDPVYQAVGPVTLVNDAPAKFPLGTTTVNWTLTDAYGNTIRTSNTVTVVSAPPTIVAPPTVTVTAGYNGFATPASLGTPTTTVSIDPATVTNAGTLAQYPIGTSNVTWTVADGIGRTASDVQQVIVVAPRPIIAPSADITISNDPGQQYSTHVLLVNPVYSAVGPVTLTNDAPLNGQFPIGTTTVTWTLTDAYGNTIATSNKVTVVSAPPTIVAPPTVTVNANAGQNYATGVVLGNATYTVSVNNAVLTNDAPAQFPVGNTTVTWTVKDGLGRTASATQMVTVKANTACQFVSSITSIPTDNTPTGGNPRNLYIGYGAQSTKLQVSVPNTGGPYTFQWTGSGLNNVTSAAPIFTPGTVAGNYTFYVAVKNGTGCTSTSSISICVRDVRSLDKNGNWDGKKVIVCHLPPGNVPNVQMIDVSINAVPTHVPNHGGDGLGNSCVQPSCSSPYARASVPAAETFGAIVYPNPAAAAFALQVRSDDKYTDVTVRIVDAFGRTVQVINNVIPGRTILFGERFASGAYYAEVIQGSDRKMIPLVKAK